MPYHGQRVGYLYGTASAKKTSMCGGDSIAHAQCFPVFVLPAFHVRERRARLPQLCARTQPRMQTETATAQVVQFGSC